MSQYAVTDPASGQVLREFPCITDTQLESALTLAAHHAIDWPQAVTARDRAALVRRVGELHTQRREELAQIIGREMGKSFNQALEEVDFCAVIYAYYADNADVFLADEPIAVPPGEGTAIIRKDPLGVLLGIMPWNFPYYQVARFAGPNLIIGNPILLKHSSQCPESSQALQDIFIAAGIPQGAYVNLYATNDQVAGLIADPRVAGVSFTGSEGVGATIAELAGRHLKKVALELGGSDPFLLLSTDHLDAAVSAAVAARLDNSGQVCNGAKRFIVLEELHARFVEQFTDAMLAASDDIAPLSSERAATGLQAQISRAVAQGAKYATRGRQNGAYFPPGVLTEVSRDHDIYREELFGPVAMVFSASSEEEAVRLANDSVYGLGAYVFSNDPEQAVRVANRIEAGMVFINGVMMDAAELPFGGVKRSGYGRELGRFGMEEFVNKKVIRIAAS